MAVHSELSWTFPESCILRGMRVAAGPQVDWNTKVLIPPDPPPRWVSAPKSYIWVIAQWQSQRCSQKLCRPFISTQTITYPDLSSTSKSGVVRQDGIVHPDQSPPSLLWVSPNQYGWLILAFEIQFVGIAWPWYLSCGIYIIPMLTWFHRMVYTLWVNALLPRVNHKGLGHFPPPALFALVCLVIFQDILANSVFAAVVYTKKAPKCV